MRRDVPVSVLSIDFETRSVVDLRRAGVYRYAEHPSTDVLCMAYAFDEEEPEIWVPGRAPMPYRVGEHVGLGGEVRAWNAQFERVIWNGILVRRHGAPVLRIEQVHDTAAEARAMGFPGSLGMTARILNLDTTKDEEGRRLMLQMSRPRKPRKGEDPNGLYWFEDEDRLQRLYEYCKQDVRTERAIAKKVRRLSPGERRVYVLDQRINDRGVYIDLDLVHAAQGIVDRGTKAAAQQLAEVTGGAVTSVTQVADLKGWLNENGLQIDSLAKNVVRDILANETLPLDPAVERALQIRQDTAKSSTAKLRAMVDATCSDGRARGLLLYHGASTGRWSGKLVQPQNFPRPTIRPIEPYIPLVMAGEYELIGLDHPPVRVVSDMLRSMIRAAPGHRLMAGDFAQIEARVVAWIAEQDDLLELFGTGGKVYEDMAAYIYGVPIESIGKDSEERQVGKNTVLGCGFGMGPDRFREQAQEQTGIDIGEELSERAVAAYREKNYRVRQFWYDIEEAAIRAVLDPGSVHSVGRRGGVRYTKRGPYLWCQLPSGRFLAYAKPEMRLRKVKRKDGTEWETESLTYMGIHTLTRKWTRLPTYGGHLTENVVQAMARDIMAASMERVEGAGYPVILTVHDEVLCEVPDGRGSLEEFLALMADRPEWAFDVPVKVEGWEGERYRK